MFECFEANLLSVSILSDLLLLVVVGMSKRAVLKECLIFGMKYKTVNSYKSMKTNEKTKAKEFYFPS